MNAVTLDPWIEGYLDYQRTVRRLAPRSLVDLRCTLKRVARDMEASHPGVALWKLALNDYVAWVNRQRAQEYSVQSINKDLSHVRGLLEYAWRSGHAQRNVLDGFSLQDAVRREVPKSLSLEQARQLVEACPVRTSLERRDRLVVLLLYGCGLHTLELCQLDVADVDRERQEITVRHGKGDRRRHVPVPAGVWTPLLAFLADRRGRRGALLRTAQKRRRLAAKDVCAIVRATAQTAGLEPWVTPKTLRQASS
jgi:site-specific recombinase XerD